MADFQVIKNHFSQCGTRTHFVGYKNHRAMITKEYPFAQHQAPPEAKA